MSSNGSVKGEAGNPTDLQVRFKDEDGAITSLKFSKYEKMQRIFNTYAAKVRMKSNCLRFHLNNKRIPNNNTLKMLEPKPTDFISVNNLDEEDIEAMKRTEREKLKIQVKMDNGSSLFYTIHPNAELRYLFGEYAVNAKLNIESLEFFYNGMLLFPERTLKMYEMKNNDVITVTSTESLEINTTSNDNRDGEQIISIILQSQFGEEMKIKVRLKANMEKVFNAYADSKGLGRDSLRFLFDGKRIKDDHTPKMLELQDGDQIDVVSEQEGGGYIFKFIL